jgi:Toxin PAAR-like domain
MAMAKVTAVCMDTITKKSNHVMTPCAVSVCTTPAAPSPLPIPYPVVANVSEGIVDPPMRTKFDGAIICTVGSCVKKCHGNEPGTLKEVVSLNTAGPCFIVMGAPVVFVELGMVGITGSPGFMNKSITVGAGGSASGAGGAGGGGGSAGSGGSGPDGKAGSQSTSGGGGGAGGGSSSGADASGPSAGDSSADTSAAEGQAAEPNAESIQRAREEMADPDDGHNSERYQARQEVTNHYFDNHHRVGDTDNLTDGLPTMRDCTRSDEAGERMGTDLREPVRYTSPDEDGGPALSMSTQERTNPQTGEQERGTRLYNPNDPYR